MGWACSDDHLVGDLPDAPRRNQVGYGLCIEDLSLEGLARTKLAKSFTDASMGEFRRQMTYKSEWNRKSLIVIQGDTVRPAKVGSCR